MWEAIAHHLMPTVYMSFHQIDKGMRLRQGAEAEQSAHWGMSLLIDIIGLAPYIQRSFVLSKKAHDSVDQNSTACGSSQLPSLSLLQELNLFGHYIRPSKLIEKIVQCRDPMRNASEIGTDLWSPMELDAVRRKRPGMQDLVNRRESRQGAKEMSLSCRVRTTPNSCRQ